MAEKRRSRDLGSSEPVGKVIGDDFDSDGQHGNLRHIEDGIKAKESDHLKRALSARQVQMIAIGGTIGTGLFLGTGKSLATGGPASLLICYAITGAIVFITMLSLGEMAAFIPIAGSFCSFAG
jgi:amino acid permease